MGKNKGNKQPMPCLRPSLSVYPLVCLSVVSMLAFHTYMQLRSFEREPLVLKIPSNSQHVERCIQLMASHASSSLNLAVRVSYCDYKPQNCGKTQFALNVICMIRVNETTLLRDYRGRRIRGVKEDESLVFVSISMRL